MEPLQRARLAHPSALHLGHCGEFLFIVAVIIAGQVLIINLGGSFFNVTPLRLSDWLLIIAGTSPVLLIGELYRLLRR